MKSLLLGNGVNAYLGIAGLRVDQIQERFCNLLTTEKYIFESVFKGIQNFNDSIEKISTRKNTGVETLAKILYSSIKDSYHGRWTDNDENRLQDILTCVSLNAIFFDSKGKITQESGVKQLSIGDYESIYTLNYYEYWDVNRICMHLHGFFDYDSISPSTKYLLSKQRQALKDYAQASKLLEHDAEYVDVSKIVFAPEGLNKTQLTSVRGVLLSNNLFPADDLFLVSSRALYEELSSVKEIDVFGVSPYGDDILIDTLNSMNYVKVFVHNLKNSEQGAIWDNMLKTKHDIVDSIQIKL